MPDPTRAQRIEGSLYGLAYGDAWGYPQEFRSWSAIVNDQIPLPERAVISDDTQMSLYVIAAALADLKQGDQSEIRAYGNGEVASADEFRVKVAEHLMVWLTDPDNNRAPGTTCVTSLRKLGRQGMVLTGLEGTNNGSKGNGANIRAPWLGLLDLPLPLVAALGAIQSSVTHNHPLALSSAAITAVLVRGLMAGQVEPGGLYAYARAQISSLRLSPLTALLPSEYDRGLVELDAFLEDHLGAYAQFIQTGDESQDICAYFGEGWVAEEALLGALALADRYTVVAPLQALHRAANSGGDSDSIAAITGALVGAGAGSAAFPADWQLRLEPRYRRDLAETLTLLDDSNLTAA
jgi:ADP-ribosylglycohydrolase